MRMGSGCVLAGRIFQKPGGVNVNHRRITNRELGIQIRNASLAIRGPGASNREEVLRGSQGVLGGGGWIKRWS